MDNFNNHSSVVHGRRNIMWRRKIMKSTLVTVFLLAMWSNTVTPQRTGEFCTLKNGGLGVCLSLARCSIAVHKAMQGDRPIVCSIYMNDPIVCCEGNVYVTSITNNYDYPQNVIPKIPTQQLPRLSHESYVFEGAPVSVDYPVRFGRGDGSKPWWFTNHPFSSQNENPPAPVHTEVAPSTSNRPSTENTNHHWWVFEKPFAFQPPKPAPEPVPAPAPIQKPQTPTRPERPVTRPIQSNSEGLRLSEIKCRDYSKLVTSQVSALPLVPVPDPVEHEVPKCEFNSVQLIVGGKEAELKEFPHMAALGYLEDGDIYWRCGGSLISEYYVLTAAHCIRLSNPPAIARLGELNLKSNKDGARPVNYMIEKAIKHPEYKAPGKYNDIALLKLERRVEFSEFIRPACIYTRNTFDVNRTIATGWGKIGSHEESSDVLRKVGLSILDNSVCGGVYTGQGLLGLSNGITDTMMCVGELAGGNDTCQGDSGGPIQITKPNNQCIFSIVGITSFGLFCAAKNTPGVYTRVSSYVPWIENIVWAQS